MDANVHGETKATYNCGGWYFPSMNMLLFITRWWFQIFFYVHPYLGKIPILTNIVQRGWNHHLDYLGSTYDS